MLLSLAIHGHNGDMRRISDIDAKNRFGQLLDAVRRQPVTVTKKGRPAAVMLTIQDYERMQGAARQRLLDTIDQMHQEAAAKGLSEGEMDQLQNEQRYGPVVLRPFQGIAIMTPEAFLTATTR